MSVPHVAKSPSGIDKGDLGGLGRSHVLARIAHIDGSFDAMALQQQGDVPALVEAGPSGRLIVVEEGCKAVGVEERLGIVLRTVADQAEKIPLFTLSASSRVILSCTSPDLV